MAVLATNRWPFWAAVTAAVFFVFAAIHQGSEHSERISSVISATTSKVWPLKHDKTFYEIALEKGTDKVMKGDHSYHEMYEKYLPALRYKKIKMLEIGLGCNMFYGPGASYYTWLEYFPHVELYYMEYNATCAEKWAHKITGATVATGDQGDPAVLEGFLESYGGDFDIIIDDGGHTMAQQMTSLQHLWKAIKPGGYYFCEDLHTSNIEIYGGGPAGMPGTMMDYIYRMIDDLMYDTRGIVFDDVASIVHIDCSRQMCLFEKRLSPTVWPA